MNSLSSLSFQLRRVVDAERGQTLVEYALIIALMSLALTAVLYNFSTGVDGLYGVIQTVVDTIKGS